MEEKIERYGTSVIAVFVGFFWNKFSIFLGGTFSPLSWIVAIIFAIGIAYFGGTIYQRLNAIKDKPNGPH